MPTETVKKVKPQALKHHKVFNFNRISEQTGIQRDKIYNKVNGLYDSWDQDDAKKKISGVLRPAVVELFRELGFNVTFEKI